MKERLTDVRLQLQDFAALFEWAISGKRWMTFAQYQDWMRREVMKEKREQVRELKRRRWIETKVIGERVVARLTEQGWQRALRDRIAQETRRCAEGVCLVMFDIPEKQRHVRNLIRGFLKEWGFQKLQHSVWMTDKDVIAPLLLLLQRRKLDRWIRVVKGTVLHSSALDALRVYKKLKR